MNESTGRGPDLQEIDKPLTKRSKRPKDTAPFSSASLTGGKNFHMILTSSVAISLKAVAISSAQLQRGSTVHFDSFTRVSKASLPTIGERSKGLTSLT